MPTPISVSVSQSWVLGTPTDTYDMNAVTRSQTLETCDEQVWSEARQADTDCVTSYSTSHIDDAVANVNWLSSSYVDIFLNQSFSGQQQRDSVTYAIWTIPTGLVDISVDALNSSYLLNDAYIKHSTTTLNLADTCSKQHWSKTNQVSGFIYTSYDDGMVPPEDGVKIIIPIKRSYLVFNEIYLLTEDDEEIKTSSLDISFDVDSWAAKFSATIGAEHLDKVLPTLGPVILKAMINTNTFVFLVEKITRTRSFEKRSISISGRLKAAQLDKPYAPVTTWANAASITARQAIAMGLENTGFTTDEGWYISDWILTPGTLSVIGTPIDIATEVANASGSVLQAHHNLDILRMLPRYPYAPWEWFQTSPDNLDYVIPEAVCQTESIEWVENPNYNEMYLSGTKSGIIAHAIREGTTGGDIAQMFTNPLITEEVAARQKATSVFAESGKKTMITLSLPILSGVGIIDVCKFVEFTQGNSVMRGISRSNSIVVSENKVRQTIKIEASDG